MPGLLHNYLRVQPRSNGGVLQQLLDNALHPYWRPSAALGGLLLPQEDGVSVEHGGCGIFNAVALPFSLPLLLSNSSLTPRCPPL